MKKKNSAISVFIGIIVYWLNYLKTCSKEYMFGIAFIVFYGISMIPDAVLIKQIDNMAFSIFFCLIGIVGSLYRSSITNFQTSNPSNKFDKINDIEA